MNELLSTCCNASYLWLTCNGCEVNEDRHDFSTCSECGQDGNKLDNGLLNGKLVYINQTKEK